ncbi:MAG: hypothetical protein U0P30_03370 [Vicinamibacterales bacterium]
MARVAARLALRVCSARTRADAVATAARMSSSVRVSPPNARQAGIRASAVCTSASPTRRSVSARDVTDA